MRRSFSIIALLAVLVVLAVLLAGRANPAETAAREHTTAQTVAKTLLGRWLGERFGAEGNVFGTRQWELLFTRAVGPAVIGQKRYSTNGSWSDFEGVNAVVDSAGRIWGVDTDGVMTGVLVRGGTLQLVYLESGAEDRAAYVVRLRRSSSAPRR